MFKPSYKLHALDYKSWIECIWDNLHDFKENGFPESEPMPDEQWDDICTAMAWIEEELESVNNLDYEIKFKKGES